jgi:hypothetical protein
MKEFMLLIRNQSDHEQTLSAETHQQFLESCKLYIEKLTREGKLIAAQPLERQGTIISRPTGTWKDGPFNETKEVIAGYYHILANDLNEAISIAKGNPEFEFGTTARIEIRPIKVKEESTGYIYPEEMNIEQGTRNFLMTKYGLGFGVYG